MKLLCLLNFNKEWKFKDPLILSFIYTYAINLYVIYILTYEGIKDNGFIEYLYFKLYSNVMKSLHKKIKNNINFKNNYRKPCFLNQKKNEKSH